MDQIDILDEKYVLKEKLVFQVGEIKEKITCTCVSFNETNSEELVIAYILCFLNDYVDIFLQLKYLKVVGWKFKKWNYLCVEFGKF